MIRKRILASICLLVPLMAAPALAGPIPASPSPVPSAGESLLTSFIVGPADSLNVDWEVLPTALTAFAPGLFAYEYQIENTSAASGVDAFSITIPNIGSVVAAGILGGDNLDLATAFHLAHDAITFPILATEADPFPLQALTSVLTTINLVDRTVSWSFDPLVAGNQSDTLYFLATLPPTYGNAHAQDSSPPSPWGSLATLGQPVPVPIPNPQAATAGMALLGSLGVARMFYIRRRQESL